jgi:hypothetical protein
MPDRDLVSGLKNNSALPDTLASRPALLTAHRHAPFSRSNSHAVRTKPGHLRARLMAVARGSLAVCLEVLVEGFAAAEVAGKAGLLLPRAGPLRQLAGLLGRECFPASAVGSACLGQGDPFLLASPITARSNSAKAPMTESNRFARGESSPVKVRFSLTNSIRTPSLVSFCTRDRRSSRFRASRSMLCTTRVSPSRMKRRSPPHRSSGRGSGATEGRARPHRLVLRTAARLHGRANVHAYGLHRHHPPEAHGLGRRTAPGSGPVRVRRCGQIPGRTAQFPPQTRGPSRSAQKTRQSPPSRAG